MGRGTQLPGGLLARHDDHFRHEKPAGTVAPAAPNGPDRMKEVVTARLRRLQRLPHIVRGFFGDPELAYITAVA